MQTRADLYKYLDYHAYEDKLDELFVKEKNSDSVPDDPRHARCLSVSLMLSGVSK